MLNKRNNARFDCNKKARLDWNGVTYLGNVINLSIAGNGVHLCVHFDGLLPGVNLNDKCELCLIDEQNPYSYNYDSKVIRVGAFDIVLSIVGMHMHL
jgi:hypothetical protein